MRDGIYYLGVFDGLVLAISIAALVDQIRIYRRRR